jgi:hypothetical protein
MTEDKWIHRSALMLCQSCMYYVPKKQVSGGAVLGRCRRRAPTMNGWPVMFPSDWCGDHKLNENAPSDA